MKLASNRRGLFALAPLILLGVAAGVSAGTTRTAKADDADKTAFNERCATRLAVSMLGTSATPEMLASTSPQSYVDSLLDAPAFVERFARFINTKFNRGTANLPEQDPAYFMTKYVLTNNKPWSDMFVGRYKVDVVADRGVQVLPDPEGLGYFRSTPWLKRYAGNEVTGLKLTTAYRILQNTVGLEVNPTTNAPEADISATGRSAPTCAPCHFTNWFALDKVAGVLSKRVTSPTNEITFEPYTGGPQQLLGGTPIGSDRELVEALVKSENFGFNACRLAFKFLYGRAENTCEGPTFDRCVDEFNAKGTITSALAVVAKNPGYCQ